MDENTHNFLYYIGKRDANAEICMMVRLNGLKETILKIAKELLVENPDHPHANWIIKNIDN